MDDQESDHELFPLEMGRRDTQGPTQAHEAGESQHDEARVTERAVKGKE